MVSPSRLGRLLLVLAGCCAPATAFALAPARAPLASVCLRSAAAPLARSDLQPRMQVVDAPVKIPDTFNPDLAPSKPSSDKANEKGKKYKLLLFNDNVNRCAACRIAPAVPPKKRRLPSQPPLPPLLPLPPPLLLRRPCRGCLSACLRG